MVNSLLPVGEYTYDKDEYSFDEAWENLEKCFANKEFIVCFAVSESEDGAYINLDYYNIRGKIFRGYLTQNRRLHNEYFIGKSFSVGIFKLNKREKTFVATHIPVELEAKRQLSALKCGEKIGGKISYIGGEGSYAFIDVKEGIMFFASAKNLFWRPIGCQKLDVYYSAGDHIVGTVNFLESEEKPQHSTMGALTCLNFEENWALETEEIKIGKIMEGFPRQEIMSQDMYYIPYSQHVYIEFCSKEVLPDKEEVRVQITEIDGDNHLVKAVLVNGGKKREIADHTEEKQEIESVENLNEEGKKINRTGSLFDLEIKATVSPFGVRVDEEIEFESTPNKNTTFSAIQKSIKAGHLNKQHFSILKAINLFIFCTTKQIMSWLYCNGELPEGFSQNKLNIRLDTMLRLGLVDRIRFKSSEGEGIYRVYFLNKNGERLLTGYLGTKRTSYQEALLATPVFEIKRYLATNQIILAFKEKFEFLESFSIRKLLWADNHPPVRPSVLMSFSNGNLLVETRRRYSGWKEDLVEKMKRYSLLFENHQKRILPDSAQFLLKKQMYLLVVCEDMEHALEIRNLLWGHTIYPYLFYTFDLLIFQKDVNFSIFRFEGVERDPTYYDVTDLLCYNLHHTEQEQQNIEESKDDEKLADFQKCLERGYFLGLEYLQKHDNPLLKQTVAEDLQELYCLDEDGNYCSVYPEEEQYYIYLLHLINRHIVQKLSTEFYGENTDAVSEPTEETLEQESVTLPGPSSPAELEVAVERVLQRIYKWCMEDMNDFQHVDAPFQVKKRPLRQTSGVQYGYDVGMNFKYHGKTYHMGFECKNSERMLKEMNAGKEPRLSADRYAYNLLEFFMFAEEDVNNIWILINPFGNLQNDFYEKLFERWNKLISFMQIRTFCSSQTDITCEEFLSLDEEAYRSIYQHEPPEMTSEEKEQLLERIFYSIVDQEEWDGSLDHILSQYPFDSDIFNTDEQMVLKTIQGDNVSEQIFERLGKNQNIFLIGEYGSGKTFMTYYIIRKIWEHQEVYPYFPLWFKLSDRSMKLTYENIEDAARGFLEDGLKQYAGFPTDLTKKGRLRVLIILDGLDEIVSGLGESELKICLLEQICRNLNSKYGNRPLFIITSREIDFKSCMRNQKRVPFFDKFFRIMIGDCPREDAIQKLKDIEKQAGWNQEEKGLSITQNNKLMSIAQKPLYFGFVREFIKNQYLWRDYVDEIDILQAIVEKSVRRYIEIDSGLTEEAVIEQLREMAREISIQMTLGGSSEILVYKWNLQSGEKNNVVRLRKIDETKYGLQFYHNAIREYLVAEELYQNIRDCAVGNSYMMDEIERRLQLLELTPEMLQFFSKLVMKNEQTKISVTVQIIKMLQAASQPSKQHLGTNLFSLLYHLNNELSDINLQGIYANNMYLWNCSLKNINLQNAHMRNLRLFGVNLEHIDFRGAELNGLIMGQDDNILDVQHYRQGNGFRIYVLYENRQLAEYRFSEYDCLENCEVICHGGMEDSEYDGFCPLENNILFYSDREIFFESDLAKKYQMSEDNRLLQVTPAFILVEQNQHLKLVMHSFKYQETSILPLMPNEKNMFCVIEQRGYLYVDEDRLFLKLNEKRYFITYLNSQFECFTAIQTMGSSQVKVYIKYNNDIQIICYSFRENRNQTKALKLPKYVKFLQMKAVKEDLLYGISEQNVYLFDLSAEDIQLYELHINVKCRDLLLENSDGTDRVQGEAAYKLLKKANDYNATELEIM